MTLPCPYGDADLDTMSLFLDHVSEHLTENAAPDSHAARLMAAWESSPAARSSSGRSQKILARLLAASLANRGVIQTVDVGAVKAAETAKAARDATAALAGIALQYEEQIAASAADRKALREETVALRTDLAQLRARVVALEPRVPPTPPSNPPAPQGG